MRNRIIRATFWLNEELADCDAHTRLMFIGLWGFADREGLFEWREKQIKASVFPYENVKIEVLLKKLLDKKFIRKYEIEGKFYGQIINFLKHQSIHKHEAQSIIPEPPTIDVDTCRDINIHLSTLIPRVCSNSNSNSNSNTEEIKDEKQGPLVEDKEPCIIDSEGNKSEFVRLSKKDKEKLKQVYEDNFSIDYPRVMRQAVVALDEWFRENPKKFKSSKNHLTRLTGLGLKYQIESETARKKYKNQQAYQDQIEKRYDNK